MADIKGDATQDEIDEQIKADLAASIGSATDTNPVRLNAGAAARILELLGGPPKAQQTGKTQQAAKAEDDEDDHPAKRRK